MNNKQLKTIAFIVGGLLLVFVVYLFFKNKTKKPVEETNNVNLGNTTAGNTPEVQVQNDELPLVIGSRGTRVYNVQNAINRIRPNSVAVDGVMGSGTRNALIAFVGTRFELPLDSSKYYELISLSTAN